MKKGLIFILLIIASCHLKPKGSKVDEVAQLPAFKLLSLDSSRCISSSNIPLGTQVLFIYFSPDCEHCQRQTKELLCHWDSFKEVSIYMITNDSIEETIQFCRAFQLDTAKNIFIGKDYQYTFFNRYLPTDVPFMAIYDARHHLKKIYHGETNIASVINAIQD